MKKIIRISCLFLLCLFLLFLFYSFKEYKRFSNHLNPYHFQQPLNIVFAGDDGYTVPLLTAITSISLNTKTPIQIYLLTNGFSKENLKSLTLLDQQLQNVNIDIITISPDLFTNFPINQRWNQSIYFRYLIPELLNKEEKALYLDGDILVFEDLTNLYSVDLKEKTIAGVPDYFEEKFLSRSFFKNLSFYINSGVLLIDMEKWRQKRITSKLFENTLTYQNQISYFDQDIINLTFKDDILPLPIKYNAIQGRYTPFKKVIYHYSGKQKPWKSTSTDSYEWIKYFDYTQAILNNKEWPLHSYLTYLLKKTIYYITFPFKAHQSEA